MQIECIEEPLEFHMVIGGEISLVVTKDRWPKLRDQLAEKGIKTVSMISYTSKSWLIRFNVIAELETLSFRGI